MNAARRYQPQTDDEVLTRLARQVHDLEDEMQSLTRLREDVAAHTRAITRLADAVHTAAADTAGTDFARTATSRAVPPAPRLAAPGAIGTGSGPGDGGGDGGGDDHPDDPTDGDEPDVDPAPAWLTVTDPAVAVQWLSELSVWVPRVWQPYLQTRTPDCWPWHPAVVAELLVVAHLWDEAVTTDEPGPAPLAAWHDRWRPGAAARIGRLMAGCERAHGRHKNAQGREHLYDLAYLDEVAHWWATTHGTDPDQPAPGLTLDLDRR